MCTKKIAKSSYLLVQGNWQKCSAKSISPMCLKKKITKFIRASARFASTRVSSMFCTERSKKNCTPAWKIAQTRWRVFPTMRQVVNLVHLFVFQMMVPPFNASPGFKVIEKIMMTVGRNMITEQIVTNWKGLSGEVAMVLTMLLLLIWMLNRWTLAC